MPRQVTRALNRVVSLPLSFLALGPAAPHPFRDALARRGGQLAATLATAHGLRRRRRRAYLLAQLVRLGCQRREAFSRLRDFALQAAKRPPDELGGFQEHISAGPAGSSTSHGRSPCQERGRLRVATADDESRSRSRSLEKSSLGTCTERVRLRGHDRPGRRHRLICPAKAA